MKAWASRGRATLSDLLMAVLRQRVRLAPPHCAVEGSLPVLFFGDALSARIATIGLNPSKFEYLDRANQILTGAAQRFATLDSLGARARSELSDTRTDEAIVIMRDYFDAGKPVYGSYFRHLTNFLRGMGVSYPSRTATHLDLVQEPTDPVWNKLERYERAQLLQRDLPFLAWELEHLPNLEAAVCAGATVSRHIQAELDVEVHERGAMKRIRWWLGRARAGQRKLPIGGWNYPLDRPTGLGSAGEVRLGELFAEELL